MKLAAIQYLSCAGQWACESGETESGGSGGQRKAEQDWSHWGPPQGGHQDQSVPKCSGERHQRPGGLKKRSHTVSGFKAHTPVAGKSLITTQAACFAWSVQVLQLLTALTCMDCCDSWIDSTSCTTEAASKLVVVAKLLHSLGHGSEIIKRRLGHSVKLLILSHQSLWCLTCMVYYLV